MKIYIRKIILKVFGMTPKEEDIEFIKSLNKNATPSMRVTKRGGLTMSAKDARKTVKIN